jgi:DNA polymerase III epsilon subunit-like protein
VEMKHAGDSPLHSIQAAIYGAMEEIPQTLLINTKSGEGKLVDSFQKKDISNAVRAILALKYSTVTGVSLHYRINFHPETEIFISVDIETSSSGKITEIGAIAFVIGSEKLIGCFHKIAKGTVEGYTADKIAEITGLEVTDKDLLQKDQSKIIKKFHSWFKNISGVRTFLHWGGTDTKQLQCQSAGSVVDAFQTFNLWLEHSGQKRPSGRTLTDAVRQVLGPKIGFTPHRAFEDATLTASVFNAITSVSGVL